MLYIGTTNTKSECQCKLWTLDDNDVGALIVMIVGEGSSYHSGAQESNIRYLGVFCYSAYFCCEPKML